MSSITGMLGGGGGAGGTGFSGPQSAPIVNAATQQQATDQYGNVVQGLQQQQNFLNAVQAQNGLGNQSQVFGQLQGVANGTGPNPAQAQLAQATAANVASQNALMAGQRGSNANVGLMARQSANQGANIQQQAAGQAATMQANQSLNALNNMGQIATNQANQQAGATNAYSTAAQGAQSNILGAIGAQNNAAVGNQSSINAANAGMANTRMGDQGKMIGGLLQGGASASMMGGAAGGEVRKMADGGQPQPMPSQGVTPLPSSVPQAVSAGPQSKFSQFLKGLSQPDTSQNPDKLNAGAQAAGKAIVGGIGSGLKSMFGSTAPSSTTPTGAAPGTISPMDANLIQTAGGDPMSQNLMETSAKSGGIAPSTDNTAPAPQPSMTNIGGESNDKLGSVPDLEADGGIIQKLAPLAMMLAAQGGKVPAMLSPGERYLSPDKVNAVAKGADPIEEGKKVPGKPKVGGAKNDYANDTIPATLEEGGIVLPRSVTQSKNPHWAAHKFVSEIMAKQALKKGR